MIVETKSLAFCMECMKFQVGFSGCLVVDCEGRSGGLVLFCHMESDLEILSYFKYHFDAWVSDLHTGIRWKIIAVYGHLEASHRCEIWNMFKLISTQVHSPWLCFKDFNETLFNSEKQRGRAW